MQRPGAPADSIVIEDTKEGCRIRVKVRPSSPRAAIGPPHAGALRVSVAAPPERGKANDAACALIARALGIPPSRVRVAAGAASREKSIAVSGMSAAEARSRLASRADS